MPEKTDAAELIDDGKTVEKKEEPKKAETKPAEEPKRSSPMDIVKGIANIPKEGPGVTENKNEPHTHLLVLIIIVIILGGVIAFINF